MDFYIFQMTLTSQSSVLSLCECVNFKAAVNGSVLLGRGGALEPRSMATIDHLEIQDCGHSA
jgi:hypothetical protein